MAGSACLATVFRAELSSKIEITTERLRHMTEKAPDDPLFPRLLGNDLFHKGDYAGSQAALDESRSRLLQLMEVRPNDPELEEELRKLGDEIAEAQKYAN